MSTPYHQNNDVWTTLVAGHGSLARIRRTSRESTQRPATLNQPTETLVFDKSSPLLFAFRHLLLPRPIPPRPKDPIHKVCASNLLEFLLYFSCKDGPSETTFEERERETLSETFMVLGRHPATRRRQNSDFRYGNERVQNPYLSMENNSTEKSITPIHDNVLSTYLLSYY